MQNFFFNLGFIHSNSITSGNDRNTYTHDGTSWALWAWQGRGWQRGREARWSQWVADPSAVSARWDSSREAAGVEGRKPFRCNLGLFSNLAILVSPPLSPLPVSANCCSSRKHLKGNWKAWIRYSHWYMAETAVGRLVVEVLALNGHWWMVVMESLLQNSEAWIG